MTRQHLVPMTGYEPNLQRWFDWMEGDHSPEGLSGQLADNVVFRSPVVHTPQEGKPVTMAYLTAAGETLGGDTFRYVRVFDCGDKAVLEFECIMDGIQVYFEGVNLTDEQRFFYQGNDRYNWQYEEYGRTYVIGFRIVNL